MRVFLSYSPRDSTFADELRRQLATRHIDVWDPAKELLPGSNWLLETGRALERSDGVVFLLSNDSTESPALRREVEYAVTNKKFERRVVPVMLSSQVENVPWILKKMSVVDATDGDAERAATRIAAVFRNIKTLPRKRLSLKRQEPKAKQRS